MKGLIPNVRTCVVADDAILGLSYVGGGKFNEFVKEINVIAGNILFIHEYYGLLLLLLLLYVLVLLLLLLLFVLIIVVAVVGSPST